MKSLFVAFGYRSHDFLPCPCRDSGLAGGPVSGSLTVCLSSPGLFKAWVCDEGYTPCLPSVLQMSKPHSGQFPGAQCSPGSHFVETAFLA